MLHYYCDGSYTETLHTTGSGILRIDQESETHHFQYTTDPYWIHKHEKFAIFQTLLLIEKHNDRCVTIWNDYTNDVTYFSTTQDPNGEIVFAKLLELKQKGFSISFRWNTDNNCPYLKKAHHISQSYRRDKEDIESSLQQVEIQQSILLQKKKRAVLQEIIEKNELGTAIETELLKHNDSIVFKKISRKKWGAFTKNNQPIHVSDHIVEISYAVLTQAFQHHQTIQINASYEEMFRSYLCFPNRDAKHERMITTIENWLTNKQVLSIA